MAISSVTRTSRRPGAVLMAALSTGGLFVALAHPAHARSVEDRKGPASTASRITMQPVNADDLVVNHGDQVTFTVSTSVTDRPMVRLYCYQSSSEVYWASAGFYADYPWPSAQYFTLRSDYWPSGAADCTATLYYSAGHNKFPTLATTSFRVEA